MDVMSYVVLKRTAPSKARWGALFLATVVAVATAQLATVSKSTAAPGATESSASLVSSAAAQADTAAPSIPGPIEVAEITTTEVTLTWAASTDNVGVARYAVQHVYTDVAMLHSTPTNSITIANLRPSATYTFSVRALDAAGNSSLSTPSLRLTMPPGDDQAPTVPLNPVPTTIGDTSVTLSWGRSTDNVYVALYEVLRIEASGNTVVGHAPQHPPTGPTARVTGLTPGTAYTFAVRARDDAGNYSALSDPVTVLTMGSPAAGCAVTYRVINEWRGAFQAEVTIRNTGPVAVDGWTLGWTFPSGQTIQYLWGAVLVIGNGSGVTVRNASWNPRIPVGGTVSFGFGGSHTGANPPPTAFALNGAICGTAAPASR